jgi:signal transduction histidine kinase
MQAAFPPLAVVMSAPPLPPVRRSLRARGVLATLALLAYLLVAGLYLAGERMRIDESVHALDLLSGHERALALTEAAVGAALLDATEVSHAPHEPSAAPEEMRLYIESCDKLFADLERFDPGYARLQRAIARSYQALQAQPVRANWLDLRESLARASAELEIQRARVVNQREQASLGYQRSYDAMSVKAALLAVFGLAAFGTLAAWFFARLAADIARLEAHARRIVGGERGVALPVKREDELGRLMHAVNLMAVDLDEREQRIALEGERRAHQDKMLALGAVAAGMAHEVNNPLAVIAGAAQSLHQSARERDDTAMAELAGQIVEHAHRAAQAARQLAEAVAPQPSQRDWTDVHDLVQRVVRWITYDRRYRGLSFDVRAAADLPALFTSAETVRQALAQMLSLACDALVAAARQRAALTVRLVRSGATVQVLVSFPAALDLAQEEVQRTLVLVRNSLATLGAHVALHQEGETGTQLKLHLPMHTDDAPR